MDIQSLSGLSSQEILDRIVSCIAMRVDPKNNTVIVVSDSIVPGWFLEITYSSISNEIISVQPVVSVSELDMIIKTLVA